MLKWDVAASMYTDNDITLADIKKEKHDVFSAKTFKSVYRARKKNHKRIVQRVKHMEVNTGFDPKMVSMRNARTNAELFRKLGIGRRK